MKQRLLSFIGLVVVHLPFILAVDTGETLGKLCPPDPYALVAAHNMVKYF